MQSYAYHYCIKLGIPDHVLRVLRHDYQFWEDIEGEFKGDLQRPLSELHRLFTLTAMASILTYCGPPDKFVELLAHPMLEYDARDPEEAAHGPFMSKIFAEERTRMKRVEQRGRRLLKRLMRGGEDLKERVASVWALGGPNAAAVYLEQA